MKLWFLKQREKKRGKVKVSKTGRLTLALAVLMALTGGGIAFLGNQQKNSLIIGVGFFLILGGILLFLRYRETLDTRILPSGKRLVQPANALLIYEDEVEFDHIKKPLGHQLRCITDGKWYHVLTGKREDKTLTEFTLPDEKADGRHYDPREFSNVVTMPANQKLFEPLDSMLKTVAVGIMGIVVCGLGVVIIAMSG